LQLIFGTLVETDQLGSRETYHAVGHTNYWLSADSADRADVVFTRTQNQMVVMICVKQLNQFQATLFYMNPSLHDNSDSSLLVGQP